MLQEIINDKSIKKKKVGDQYYIKLYRGATGDDDFDGPQSWTTSKTVAENFSDGGKVQSGWFNVYDDIDFSMEHSNKFGTKTHSGEAEIISRSSGVKNPVENERIRQEILKRRQRDEEWRKNKEIENFMSKK